MQIAHLGSLHLQVTEESGGGFKKETLMELSSAGQKKIKKYTII